jgi:acetaldehyde dehydrogenase (acetylating)
MKFAMEKPAFRIMVNTQSALGAVGYTTGLDPSMTLGPGTWGGSIASDNITARHLLNIKRLAFETHPVNPAASIGAVQGTGWAEPTRRPAYGVGLSEKDLDGLIARYRKEIG